MIEMLDRKERPSYVSFHRVAVEDIAASKAAGHFVAKDVDYVHITPAYSKDVMKFKVPQWFENMKVDVVNNRLPEEWVENYKKQYAAWQNGQELPVNGTPIKGWGVLSPAQQETLIRMNIRTVEDLAAVTDEGIRRIGMGAVDLKNKANAWLAQLNDKGPITQKMSALEQENAILNGQVETLTRQVSELMSVFKQVQGGGEDIATALPAEITAGDILEPDDAALYKLKYGKAPHPAMKPETMAAKLRD